MSKTSITSAYKAGDTDFFSKSPRCVTPLFLEVTPFKKVVKNEV